MAHDAKVYDEKPLSLMQSWRQRRRWMQGHTNVAGRYVGKLFLEGIRTRNFAMIDGAMYLIQPFFLMFTGLCLIGNLFMYDQVYDKPMIAVISFFFAIYIFWYWPNPRKSKSKGLLVVIFLPHIRLDLATGGIYWIRNA
ncbi:MAG: hypothetical protein RQM92_15125 [Candidatus Syntrophopropionicum ammoniitolerans]